MRKMNKTKAHGVCCRGNHDIPSVLRFLTCLLTSLFRFDIFKLEIPLFSSLCSLTSSNWPKLHGLKKAISVSPQAKLPPDKKHSVKKNTLSLHRVKKCPTAIGNGSIGL